MLWTTPPPSMTDEAHPSTLPYMSRVERMGSEGHSVGFQVTQDDSSSNIEDKSTAHAMSPPRQRANESTRAVLGRSKRHNSHHQTVMANLSLRETRIHLPLKLQLQIPQHLLNGHPSSNLLKRAWRTRLLLDRHRDVVCDRANPAICMGRCGWQKKIGTT